MLNNVLVIILYLSLAFVLLLFLAWLFNVVIFILSEKKRSPKYYVKEIPFLINQTEMYRVHTAGQFLGITLLTAVIMFTILSNTTPFGVTVKYSMLKNSTYLTHLVPKERVTKEQSNGSTIFRINGDLVYFTTSMPFAFNHATVKVYFKNNNIDQTMSVGFQDRDDWHYVYKPIDVPFLNKLNWVKNGLEPVLYQRERKYISTDHFFSNPPQDSIIGTFEYKPLVGDISLTRLPSYKPKEKETVINTAIRGRHTIYVYLENERFNMKILKQDLNWYEDEDIMKVKIYKEDELVHEVEAADDGIKDKSKKIVEPTEVSITNPGEEMPESGIYKVVIEANADTVIKQIRTNLHKLVFANSIFPISNSEAYPGVVATTSATKLYTNSLTLSAMTSHKQGIQNILVGDQVLGVASLNTHTYLPPKDIISEVTIPKNDVILNGFLGYFSFEKDQFFLPTEYHILPLSKESDVNLVDYILAEYLPSSKEGEWQVNEQTFDLRNAYIKNNKLSWNIRSPLLKDRKNEIIIKDIEITFRKDGWFNSNQYIQ